MHVSHAVVLRDGSNEKGPYAWVDSDIGDDATAAVAWDSLSSKVRPFKSSDAAVAAIRATLTAKRRGMAGSDLDEDPAQPAPTQSPMLRLCIEHLAVGADGAIALDGLLLEGSSDQIASLVAKLPRPKPGSGYAASKPGGV